MVTKPCIKAEEEIPVLSPIKRLCNEIQLFDLCDKNVCFSKSGNYCTENDLLTRFENIEEQESRRPSDEFSVEIEDTDEVDHDIDEDEFYDDEFYDEEE